MLEMRLAHARARDAVHAGWDEGAVVAGLPGAVVVVDSAAGDRREYLMRPDLGRRLGAGAGAVLAGHAGVYDLAIVVSDGLSALAVARHAGRVIGALMPALGGWALAPVVLVRGGRVAVGDAVGMALGARGVLMLIGERPGLSAPDSLGAYLTWGPSAGTTDAGRNCVSNIRPEGLSYGDAAHRIFHLLERMRVGGVSGVMVKDESDMPLGLEAPPSL